MSTTDWRPAIERDSNTTYVYPSLPRPSEPWLEQRLEVWRERLGLQLWQIRLEVGGCEDEDSYMEVYRARDYDRAVIHVQPWVLGDGEGPAHVMERQPDFEFVEQSLVHELLHLYAKKLRWVIDDVDGHVHRDMFDLLRASAVRAEEELVDRLATALVRAFGADTLTESSSTT